MAFTEEQQFKIEIIENGCIQVRRSDIVLKDGVEVGRQFHRHCLSPGDDVSREVPRVRDVANAAWTPEVVAAYEASLPKEPAPEPEAPVTADRPSIRPPVTQDLP